MSFSRQPNLEFLRQAISLATSNVSTGKGGPFGAVVVRDGKVIAEGVNVVTATNDPTAHAEVTAIRNACKALSTFTLTGCELYSSCEPCPMCLAASHWARLDAVFLQQARKMRLRLVSTTSFCTENSAKIRPIGCFLRLSSCAKRLGQASKPGLRPRKRFPIRRARTLERFSGHSACHPAPNQSEVLLMQRPALAQVDFGTITSINSSLFIRESVAGYSIRTADQSTRASRGPHEYHIHP
ncbi:nucleoside deaminase [Occallatibacter savannae]|uniref:nucleoside deaminase n=1 Tax=Occallatibacter savannae TaxID=1002691 RepID=UPI0023B793DE|nr:nucleoside deaminase [Occallatibacter savannae]